MVNQTTIDAIKSRVAAQREDIITFLKELCAIPSYDSQIRAVGERAESEMKKLGFADAGCVTGPGPTIASIMQRFPALEAVVFVSEIRQFAS